MVVVAVLAAAVGGNGLRGEEGAVTTTGWPAPMTSDECWKAMPPAVEGSGQPLPAWARMLARPMPRTAAAFLELDLAQRTKSPLDPKLRAAMRWVSAHANRCDASAATAKADAFRAGVAPAAWASLESGGRESWSEAERAALDFALAMTLDSDGVTDAAFAELVARFGERRTAAMVLLMAYANFQDRLLLCLGCPPDDGGPLPPVEVRFAPDALVLQTTPPARKPPEQAADPTAEPTPGEDIVDDGASFTWLSYPELQERLRSQRERTTRLPVPEWSAFADALPPGLMEKPLDLVWYKIAFGYAHELAVPFEIYMRTAGSEVTRNWDRHFGNCLFWMVTDAVHCPYCMGHCEMNWEVMGLGPGQIADVSRVLAGSDWSSYGAPEQRALAFARTLTATPWKVTRDDLDALRAGFGDERAFYIALNCSRYNYMTRISNGFQLTLESGNPFWDYYKLPAPPAGK